MKAYTSLMLILLSLCFLCSCSADNGGRDITAFCARFNENKEIGTLSTSDFFITQEDGIKTYRAYSAGENGSEILISLQADASDTAISCTAVFCNGDIFADSNFQPIICDIISAYCEYDYETSFGIYCQLKNLSQEKSGVEHICNNTTGFQISIYCSEVGTVICLMNT